MEQKYLQKSAEASPKPTAQTKGRSAANPNKEVTEIKNMAANYSAPGMAQLKSLAKNRPSQFAPNLDNEEERKKLEEKDKVPGAQMKKGEQEISSAQTTTASLPEEVQAKMENTMGHDFSDVNIHKDSQNAQEVGALAYAQGDDVHFAPGQFKPSTSSGQELIGHELAHVAQQREGRVKPTTQAKGMPVNDDAKLEKEADDMGKKAAQGKFEKTGQKKKTSVQSEVAQGFKMSLVDSFVYPKFKKFVKNEMPKKSNDARITTNLDTFGTNTGATKRDTADDMKWGNGPTIDVKKLSGANGTFMPGIGSSVLNLNKDIVKAYQNATTNLSAHELFLESTILHEYTHYLDDQDGVDRAGEEGQGFEEATYGTDIDSVADAQGIMNGNFAKGKWKVEVISKNAGFKQRFKIKNSGTSDGTYDGIAGKKVSIDSKTPWSLKVQHNSGKKWANSQMIKVEEGTDNYLLRTEDWTDSDRNDLVIRVKK